MNYLIIAAGGNGERMGLHHNKIFAKIGNKPIIYWTIKAFEEARIIDKILISAKLKDIKHLEQIIKKYRFNKVEKIIEASSSRQESTWEILKWLKSHVKEEDLVGVHNGVNPFVSLHEIEEVYLQAKKHKAALLAYPASDTIKITDEENIVQKTPIRKYCWYAQTPQVAIFKYLYQAFVKAAKDQFLGTDDTQLLERVGIKSKLIKCSHRNFKITFPEDLIVARNILKLIKQTNGKKIKNSNEKIQISNLDCHSRVGGNLISNGHLFIGSPARRDYSPHSRG